MSDTQKQGQPKFIPFYGNIDPSHEHKPDDPRIFVFGSNVRGIHGAGAAAYAMDLGAVIGEGEGLFGQSYALPTCYEPGEPVTFPELIVYVQNFIKFAQSRPDLQFFVSAVGCGIAGFDESEVGPLFKDAPPNCDLPPGWREDTVCTQSTDSGQCGAPGAYLYRYEYVAERRRVNGGAVCCEAHRAEHLLSEDVNDDWNMANPRWVKL